MGNSDENTQQKIEMVAIQPNDWNPNTMTDDQFAELVAEVEHLGKPAKPIVLRANGSGYQIVDGEHSYRALVEAGHDALQPGWFVVEQYDDLEAMRQTYKRNRGGSDNPVKLGQMFRRAMQEGGLSQRQLADLWGLSEGTVRNKLEYAKAADKARNDYAVDSLSVKQIRTFNVMPTKEANDWLEAGAELFRREEFESGEVRGLDVNDALYFDGIVKVSDLPDHVRGQIPGGKLQVSVIVREVA